MVTIRRWFRHAFALPWRWRVIFSKDVLAAIEAAITASEAQHRGEIRFALENALPPGRVWQGVSARQRATEVFSNLGVWNTEENCGVLIYLMLADREVHIVADRGIHKLVEQAEWDAVAETMRQHFIKGDYKTGSIKGVESVMALLASRYPANNAVRGNELPNSPVFIRK